VTWLSRISAVALAASIGVAGFSASAGATTTRQIPIGSYSPNEDHTWQGLSEFSQKAGESLSWAEDYESTGSKLAPWFLHDAAANHTEPVIQLLPTRGAQGAWLTRLAKQVKAFGKPVILAWMPEANGNWYWWGHGRSPVSRYRDSWKDVISHFRGVQNVRFMVVVNRTYQGAGSTRSYITEIPDVSYIGIDGYYETSSDTFNSVIGATLAQVRAVTGKPVLISETAAGVGNQARDIPGLIAGIRHDHLKGMIWFNQDQHEDIYHQDWQMSPAGFRALAKALE
jgi:hypothetical protein